jgi:hypothetical protein|tara:strand:- start:654 stop:815 length:162 start_codon:yes stop_codon:yes gene_type:complete
MLLKKISEKWQNYRDFCFSKRKKDKYIIYLVKRVSMKETDKPDSSYKLILLDN